MEQKYTLRQFALLHVIWLFTEGLGWIALVLIAYSGIAAYLAEPWKPVEKYAETFSAMLTLVGTLITAAAIYVPQSEARPAWWHSRVVVAPLVIAACTTALFLLFRAGHLPPTLINGFSLLAISGGLKRMLPSDVPSFARLASRLRGSDSSRATDKGSD